MTNKSIRQKIDWRLKGEKKTNVNMPVLAAKHIHDNPFKL